MPETIFIRDFSAGWTPSDDAINGRPNGLLQMDNLELDRNGALTLIGGTAIKHTGFPVNAHTMYSRFINGMRCDYSALLDGQVYRNSTSIITGGDTKNTAFSTAFNFTLICSGDKRYKDSGTALVSLGVSPATVKPTVVPSTTQPFTNIGKLDTDWVIPTSYGTASYYSGPPCGLACTANGSGQFALQTYNAALDPVDLTKITGPSGDISNSTSNDNIQLKLFLYPVLTGYTFQIDILLEAGNAAGDQVSDYYTYLISDLSLLSFDPVTSLAIINIKKSDFTRVGIDTSKTWAATYGYRLTIKMGNGDQLNLRTGTSNIYLTGGSNTQDGIYQFAQVNVNNTGSYVALSPLSPLSDAVELVANQAYVTLEDPSGVDSQVNEVWLYARSTGSVASDGNTSSLNVWHRVAKLTTAFSTPFYVTVNDLDTLALHISYDESLSTIASSNITDKILDIVGPTQGRWFYFTPNFMYPSDINDPDLVNTTKGVRTCGSASEVFMWARAISSTVVLVGTSCDIYLLTGTFTTLPDGTIDIYYQPLGVKFPPITNDAVAYGGSVYYLANDGWRMCVATSFGTTYSSQNNQLLVTPNTDRLYRGETCYGYTPPNLKIEPGSKRFPVVISRNKLWCFITGTGRGEVYDFARQYWRTFNYGLNDATAACSTQDGQVLVFYELDAKIREIGIQSSKLIDGTTKQNAAILLPYKDNDKPRQRKDTYTLRCRCYTPDGCMVVYITNEKNVISAVPDSLVSLTGVTEQMVDISEKATPNITLLKSLQIYLGAVSVSDLIISDISIDYDLHPLPLTFLKLQPSNFTIAQKKRVRTWPFVMDTQGNDVTFTPDVDGVAITPTTFNTDFKKTVYQYYNTDVFGVDYGGTFCDPKGLMEIWGIGQPDIVQALPIPRRYDQIGPLDLLRYGRVVKMLLRVHAEGGTVIPFKVYSSDTHIWSDSFTVTDGIEDSYIKDLPKGVGSRITRIELGPTSFNFYRYYVRLLVASSGGQENTELRWITLPSSMGSVSEMMSSVNQGMGA